MGERASGGKSVCVYCSSSASIDPVFNDAARSLGTLLGEHGHALVYGGASVGTMGEVARAAKAAGARVVGVIPESMIEREIAWDGADELIVTADMRERKATMDARADAFVALPGGFGTLEELLEVLTLRLLEVHTKPIILANIEGFYDPLLALFEELYETRFARPESRSAYRVASTVEDVITFVEAAPAALPSKWL